MASLETADARRARPLGAVWNGSTALDHWALERVQRSVAPAPITFALWDGYARMPQGRTSIATITFGNRLALLRWVWNSELYFGESYMSGDVRITGDLVALLDAVYRATPPTRRRHRPWRQVANGTHAARDNVHRHYDLGNAFYRLWLDREMVYTCAYFPTPATTLEDAQTAKLDLVCRKLRLAPGEHVIEAGCGWGAFALYAARHYGVTVDAYNISAEQIRFARQRAVVEGLDRRVRFFEADYRRIEGRCDVFASIGMLEHVGVRDYGTLGSVIDRVLAPEGRGLLHFIGRDQPAPLNAWIRRRIFPGAYAPVLREVCAGVLEPYALSVLDVENLRRHYEQTLAHWRARFAVSSAAIAQMFDDRFVRAWDLYLAGSQVAFATGWMQLFQVLFTRSGSNAIPWTRVAG